MDISTDGTYVTWKIIPPAGYHVKYLVAIVKGSEDANIYFYDQDTRTDSGLSSPINSSGNPAGLSNLTICYVLEKCEEETCFEWKDESATGRGNAFTNTRPSTWFQWNSRDQLINGDAFGPGVNLIYGRDLIKAGRVTISDPAVNGDRTITVTLDAGFRLKQDADGNIIGGALKVFASNTTFTQFTGFTGALQSNTGTIKVPDRAYYFVHADIGIGEEVECPVVDK